MTVEPGGRHRRTLEPFEAEVSAAVRYERGLVVKALVVIVVLAVVVAVRTLYFALPSTSRY